MKEPEKPREIKLYLRKKKDNKKNKNKANTEENLKPTVQYVKLNGQLKKIFVKDEQVDIVEKCSNEIYQLIEIASADFNFQKYLNQLNRTEPEKYINRVKPCFFDEDTNEKLSPDLFVLSKSEKKENIPKKEIKEEEDEAYIKFQTLFGYKKSVNKKSDLFLNRKKTIVYNYVLVNSNSTGETFGEMIYESNKSDEISPRLATIISKENCHFATLRRELYNKILKEFNANNLHQQFAFLYSLDLFKDCNKNTLMKNMSFFIKRTIRANEVLFNQDDNGKDRSIYFVESGSFNSYCNISINDIEVLFNNLNYNGLILPDDAHEDNLFNKENHYFCQFKKKKIFINLFNYAQRDLIGYNEALYNDKYIYTVRCQSSTAIVYEIKLKFFDLIVNSEVNLYQILEKYEVLKRNIMMKLFLNAFNNKMNFYKFISFDDLEKEKEVKNIVHKNYFGKNPFVDEKGGYDKDNDRQNFKLNKTVNKVMNNIVEIMPELKKVDVITTNSKITDIKQLTKSINESKYKKNFRQNNNLKITILSNKDMNKFLGSSRNIKQIKQISTEKINRTLKHKLSGIYSKEKFSKIKIDSYNNDNTNSIRHTLPIINHTLTRNNNDNEMKESYSTSKNKFNSKTLLNLNSKEIIKNNENSFGSSILTGSFLKTKNSFQGLRQYTENKENTVEPRTNERLNRNEEIRIKKFLKDIPDFFENNKNSKKIFFGMNNKALYQNNVLFTDFK